MKLVATAAPIIKALRNWKCTITVFVVGLISLIVLGSVLMMSGSSNEPAITIDVTTATQATTITCPEGLVLKKRPAYGSLCVDPTPTSIQVTCLAGSVPRTSITGAVTCVQPTPVVRCQLYREGSGQVVCEDDVTALLRQVKAHLAASSSGWCPARYLSWLFWENDGYHTDTVAAAYWLALEEPCRPPITVCVDGWISHSQHRSGTCSWHEGIAR